MRNKRSPKKPKPSMSITVCGLKTRKPTFLRALGKLFQAVYRLHCVQTGAHLSCRRAKN